MKKALWLITFILMSVITLTLLHSFFLPNYLSDALNKGEVTEFEQDYAKRLKLPAYYHFTRINYAIGSAPWLQATIELAKEDVQYCRELASFYLSKQEKERAEFWLKQAVKRQDKEGTLSLASFYFSQNRYVEAKELLFSINNITTSFVDERASSLLIELFLNEGDFNSALVHYRMLAQNSSQSLLVKEIETLGIFAPLPKQTSREDCPASIQLFATNLADFRTLANMVFQVEKHALGDFVCFEPIRYISYHELKCRHRGEQRIQCDERIWQALKSEIKASYIGVMVPEGGANVNHGLLYLDSNDTLPVFIHELSHLLGFVDEYPLPVNHQKCLVVQSQSFSHNVAVLPEVMSGSRDVIRQKVLAQLPWAKWIKQETPILQEVGQGWQLGTPDQYKNEIGLFVSATCKGDRAQLLGNGISLQSFKPLSSLSHLAYFELAFPPIYLEFLRDKPQRFLMPSFQTNIQNATRP